MAWLALELEVAAEMAQYARHQVVDEWTAFQRLAELAELERQRKRAAARRRYLRDRADPVAWAARLARVEARRRRLVAAADPTHLEAGRRRSRRAYEALMADPDAHARYLARRRSWYARTRPGRTCADCGCAVDSRRALRCPACLALRRRRAAAGRQARYRLMRRT